MPSTTNYSKWDLILVPFPFTDLTSAKRRPALIVSPNDYNHETDVVIAFITSKVNRELRLGGLQDSTLGKSQVTQTFVVANEIRNY